jgi:hypothetical protein
LATLGGGPGWPRSRWSPRRLRLPGLSSRCPGSLWMSLRLFRSWRLLGMPGAPASGRQVCAPPLAEPAAAGPRSAASWWCAGSMSFCQPRSSFLARLASSSLLVFLRTSLMSFPSRVSYRHRATLSGWGAGTVPQRVGSTALHAPLRRWPSPASFSDTPPALGDLSHPAPNCSGHLSGKATLPGITSGAKHFTAKAAENLVLKQRARDSAGHHSEWHTASSHVPGGCKACRT